MRYNSQAGDPKTVRGNFRVTKKDGGPMFSHLNQAMGMKERVRSTSKILNRYEKKQRMAINKLMSAGLMGKKEEVVDMKENV